MKRVLFACFGGSVLEFYEFTLFGFLSGTISKVYFHSSDEFVSTILTFGTFATGFLARPIGGIIFGHLGDKRGRMWALRISIILMGLSTTLIGLIPSYQDIGVIASVTIIILRVLQGLSAGGEFTGGLVLAVEHCDKNKRNFWGAFVTSACTSGMLLGAIVSKIVTLAYMPPWAWRVGFILGLGLSYVAYYMRKQIVESPEFIAVQDRNNLVRSPLRESFKHDKIALLIGFLMSWFTGVFLYMLVFYTPHFLKTHYVVSADYLNNMNVLTLALIASCITISGYLCDTFERYKIMKFSGLFLILISFSYFSIYPFVELGVFIGLHIFVCVLASLFWGGMNTLVVENFRVETRYSGAAFSYGLGIAIFGGTAPLVGTYLLTLTSGAGFLGGYLALSCLCGFVALLLDRHSSKNTFSNDLVPEFAFAQPQKSYQAGG